MSLAISIIPKKINAIIISLSETERAIWSTYAKPSKKKNRRVAIKETELETTLNRCRSFLYAWDLWYSASSKISLSSDGIGSSKCFAFKKSNAWSIIKLTTRIAIIIRKIVSWFTVEV